MIIYTNRKSGAEQRTVLGVGSDTLFRLVLVTAALTWPTAGARFQSINVGEGVDKRYFCC
jgi:hypothetical protein